MSSRIVCQFSCGAASAVATKLALAQYGATHDVQIINAFVAEEHPDNRRFLEDCEKWFGRPITQLRDEKYGASALAVFRQKRFIVSQRGAPCTTVLKRKLMDDWKQPGDVMVLGFTAEEVDRLMDFRERNPDRPVLAPLIERGLGKADCKAMIERAGIEMPVMYRLGYYNNNCIACGKGGEGYFRAIREDFPEHLEALAQLQDELGPGSYFLRFRSGPRKDERMSLRELPEGPARRDEEMVACSFFCAAAEAEYSETTP